MTDRCLTVFSRRRKRHRIEENWSAVLVSTSSLFPRYPQLVKNVGVFNHSKSKDLNLLGPSALLGVRVYRNCNILSIVHCSKVHVVHENSTKRCPLYTSSCDQAYSWCGPHMVVGENSRSSSTNDPHSSVGLVESF